MAENFTGNDDEAITQLEAGFEYCNVYRGWELTLRSFGPLQEIPAFIALRARNLKKINEERAVLGFEPLSEECLVPSSCHPYTNVLVTKPGNSTFINTTKLIRFILPPIS